jgi:hypothetical protein
MRLRTNRKEYRDCDIALTGSISNKTQIYQQRQGKVKPLLTGNRLAMFSAIVLL